MYREWIELGKEEKNAWRDGRGEADKETEKEVVEVEVSLGTIGVRN